MLEFLKDFVNDKFLFFGSILTLLLLIIIIVILIRRSKKLKKLEQIVEKEPLEELDIPKTKIEFSKTPIINIEKKQEINNEDKTISNELPKEEKTIQLEAKIEVEEKIQSASENIEDNKEEYNQNKSDLETMLDQMQNDLEKKQNDVSSFEEEQEENSVISYQELISKMKNKTADTIEKSKVTQKVVEKESNDSLNEIDIRKEIVRQNVPKEETTRTFRNTEFISPVYGKMESDKVAPKVTETRASYREKYQSEENRGNNVELEKTLRMAPISKEIKRNEDFLRALKEFRSNL